MHMTLSPILGLCLVHAVSNASLNISLQTRPGFAVDLVPEMIRQMYLCLCLCLSILESKECKDAFTHRLRGLGLARQQPINFDQVFEFDSIVFSDLACYRARLSTTLGE